MSHTENDCYFSELPESRLSRHNDIPSPQKPSEALDFPQHVWYGPSLHGSSIDSSFPGGSFLIESEKPLLFEGKLYTGLVKRVNGH